MGITINGIKCIDPKNLKERCDSQSPPIPTDSWFGKANLYKWEMGTEPGTGYLLVPRGALQTSGYSSPGTQLPTDAFSSGPITLSSSNQLTFNDGATSLTIPVWVEEYYEATPGAPSDQNAATVLKIVDRRWLLQRTILDVAYNVKSDSFNYYQSTLYGGTSGSSSGGMLPLWTWNQLIQNLWSLAGLGTFPGFPGTAVTSDTPTDVEFWKTPANLALNYSLFQVGCLLCYNPITDSYSIVRMGDTSSMALSILNEWWQNGWKIWDDFGGPNPYRNLPANLAVYFRWAPNPGNGLNPFYKIQVGDTNPNVNYITGTLAVFDDQIAADYNEGNSTPTNLAELTTRANNVAADFYAREKNFFNQELKAFGKVSNSSDVSSLFGPQISGFSLEDRGEGVKISASRNKYYDNPQTPQKLDSMMVVTAVCFNTCTVQRQRITFWGTAGFQNCAPTMNCCNNGSGETSGYSGS